MKSGWNGKSWLTTAIVGLAGNLWMLGAVAAEVQEVPGRDDNVSVIAPELYCVIDLSEGSNATNYPVSYRNGETEGGFNTDEYKTTKLVLRRIAPGTFVMAGSCTVTLTKPFYIGIFEFTQKQYALVTGSNPSAYGGDKRPVDRVPWNVVRGRAATYNWPEVKTIDPNSFAARLRARTGLTFDLPTEAQWEYACRASTTGDYNNEGDLGVLGRFSSNRGDGKGGYSEHTTVGSYLPNAWGLYDMHGNISEWCLDRWRSPLADSSAIDPEGPGYPTSGEARVRRGGSWTHPAEYATSSWRGSPDTPSGSQDYNGFRIACPASEKYEQSIDFAPIETQLTTNQVVLRASATSGNEVTFSVVSGGGVVAGDILTFTEPGTVVVAAYQAGDEIWNAAAIVTQEVEVQAVPTRLTIEGLLQTYDGAEKVVTVTTEPEGIAVRVTYDGAEEAPVHAGDYAVVAETADVRFAGRAEGTLKVVKAAQTIEFPAVGWQEWTNEVVLGAVAESGLVVEYAVMSGPGRVNGNSLTFTGPGSVVVCASQSGNEDWNPAEDVFLEVVAGKATAQVILGDLVQVYDGEAKAVTVMTAPTGLEVRIAYDGVEAVPQAAGRYDVTATVEDEKWVGSATGTLVVSKGSQSIEFGEIGAQAATNVVELSAVASTGMEVKFAVLSGPGAVSGNVLTFTGAGTVTVMALQEGDANWAQATVLRTVSVSAVPVEVVLSGLEQVFDGQPHGVTVTTAPEGVAVRVTYDGAVEEPVLAGSYAVVAESADGRYAGRAEGTLVVSKGSQSIEFAEIGEQVATNVVELGAVASSGLAVGYAVEGPGVLEGGVLSFTGAGVVTVTASQAGDGNWEAAEAVSVSFEVRKAVAEVELSGLSQLYDGGGKEVEVQTVPEGLSVSVTYDGNGEEPVDAGTYAVVATVVDDRWEGSATGTLVVAKGAQGIEFAEIGEQVATNVVVLGAVASSGLEVSYTVEGPAVVEGSVLSFTGGGTVVVTASQAGDGNWEAAEDVVRSFEVRKAVAEVSLEGVEQVFDGKTHGVEVATVPEGLSVSVTYDGSGEEPVDAGTYAVVATVMDDRWEGSAMGTLVVAKGSQSIVFGEIGDQVVTNVVELGAVASSGLAVGYSVEGPAVLEGSVLRFSGVGVVSVTASQAGNGNWEAAEAVSVSFEVRKAVAGVVLEGLEQVYDGETHRVGVGTVPEGLSVAVTYDGEESEPVDAGSYRVVAVVVDEVWEGSAEGVLSIAKGAQEIVFPEIGPCGVADRVELSAVAGSGLEVVFAVLSGPGYLEGAVLRFADTGSVAVVAMQGGDVNWEAAEPVRQVVEVGKSAAAVELAGLEQVYDGNAHAVAVETVPAGLAVEVAYGGSINAPVDAGSYEVVATVVDAKWAGCATGVLHVAKGTQEIAFPAIGPQVVTNRVVLGAVASSGLPVGYAVAAGPGRVEDGVLSFSGVGEVAVVASQYGDGNWEAAAEVTNVVAVSGLLSLSVVSAHGVVSPAAGVHEVMIGTAVEAVAEAEPVVLGEGWRAVCTGWRLEGNGPEAGTGTVAAFTLTNSATLTWLWETQALVQAVGLAHGDAEGGGWYALGSTAVLRAVPDEGFAFTGWTGAVPGGQAGANPVELRVAGQGTAVATFYTTFYASVDGDDAADGLSWSTAKREIASALALAAEGDSVVASDGAYGAVSVPDGVSVRSVGGAEATRIAGDAGVRCVVAGAGASVEGFTLEGASVEGDGGGALLAGDAVLRRCVLQGNRAGGCGGGASGGTLENCLVVGNGASAGGGGGACGAVLRHCTVVRNEGGGARDCRSVNCVFWENGGDDVAGGETSWSRCSPAAPGSGNIEDDPVFAGGGDWRLAYESPCIDAAAESGVRVDLDGAPRPQPRVYGGELKPDMGCREYVPKARFVWDQGRAVPPYESWGDAARDIQSALDVSGSGDRIVVEAGTYGPIAVSNAVIVMGYRGAAETVIDAQGAERAVFLGGGGTLEGFTVRGGVSEDCGGILADGGSTVRDVVVEGCRATGAEGVGGGVCLYGGSVAENVTARGNAAAYGAGVYATATSAVVHCEMDGNTASAWGGGAYLEADSRMECSRLSSNSAVRGGGLYGADCEVAACGLDGNAASGAGGGAALLRATFRNNRVAGNRAASGGGVHAQASDGHDCLVTGNEAPKGAGVWMEGDGQFWNFTVADNVGTGAGVALRGTSLFGNGIAWGNAGGNLDAAEGTEVRHSCAAPAPDGEGNFAADPSFVGDGDYHLRAGSPCVDTGEVQEWMALAYDFDGQRRVEFGEAGDGRDIWVDIGTDEAVNDAVDMPSAAAPWWTWRVVMDARLQLQSTTGLVGAEWEDAAEPFTATGQIWTLDEPFTGRGKKFYRLIWKKE